MLCKVFAAEGSSRLGAAGHGRPLIDCCDRNRSLPGPQVG
jgi:hypothetical protein